MDSAWTMNDKAQATGISEGKRGLGFGVGTSPAIPSLNWDCISATHLRGGGFIDKSMIPLGQGFIFVPGNFKLTYNPKLLACLPSIRVSILIHDANDIDGQQGTLCV